MAPRSIGASIDLNSIDLATLGRALPPCDAMEKPDEKKGVFVRATGGSPAGKGDAVSPLDNIAAALAPTQVSGRSMGRVPRRRLEVHRPRVGG